MITVSDAPSLGLELLPGLEKRADAIVPPCSKLIPQYG